MEFGQAVNALFRTHVSVTVDTAESGSAFCLDSILKKIDNAFVVDNFAIALDAISDLKRDGVIIDYAIGGAMALSFWSEPAATFDLDVFVLLKSIGILVSLDQIYRWARERGYPEKAEHVIVAGVPVQFIVAPDDLAAEAVHAAADLDYNGHPVRVMRPEFLIALYLQPAARTRRRLERVAGLLEEGNVDRLLLDDLLKRYKLELPH